jgi:hypothetical protein
MSPRPVSGTGVFRGASQRELGNGAERMQELTSTLTSTGSIDDGSVSVVELEPVPGPRGSFILGVRDATLGLESTMTSTASLAEPDLPVPEGVPLEKAGSVDRSGSVAALFSMEGEPKDLVSWELISGFVDEADGPILRVYNVQRCTGLEVHPALFFYCRHSIVIADGFAKVDSAEAPGVHGTVFKRVEEATTGVNASGVPHGAGSQRFQVYLREGTEADAAGEFYSDAVRINREEKAAEEGKGAGDGGADDLGFDLDDPPHVERIRFDRLKILYKRRYQFRHVGVEFFDLDGRSCLTAFETPEDQDQVVNLILDNAPIVNSDFAIEGSKIGSSRVNYRRFITHYKKTLTKNWQSGKITNFEYLMHLNALAGRSFHDLTQYPVFPWILSDYTSTELDLSNPAVYRDLSKPMGALGESRARQFRERFEALQSLAEDEDNADEPPPFHYGTHYSCAGYVLYYLLRLEPYTRLHMALQGGKFDKSDRLFRDMRASWESASRDNLQDVRELIPEFFYLPDFLVNTNKFDYGWLQRGLPVNHVMLPPWAKGDAREFIRLHRMALESKTVSESLHNWIDLIFGYKQQGKAAEEAQNKFVHLTYEGVVDIDAISDPIIRDATIAQIHNFGQTPNRLFKHPHVARRVPTVVQGMDGGQKHVDLAALAWHQHNTPSLCIVGAPEHIPPTPALRVVNTSQIGQPYGGAISGPNQPVGDVWLLKDRAVGVGQDCTLVPPSLVKYALYGSSDYGVTFRVAIQTTRYREVDRVVSVHEQLHLGAVNCMVIEDVGEIAVTGSKDSTVRVWALQKHASSQKSLSLLATLCGHTNEVLCVDIAPAVGIIVSGGFDKLAVVWDLQDYSCQRLLFHAAPVASVSINRRTGDVVTLAGVDMRIFSITGKSSPMTPSPTRQRTHEADRAWVGGGRRIAGAGVGHLGGEGGADVRHGHGVRRVAERRGGGHGPLQRQGLPVDATEPRRGAGEGLGRGRRRGR